MSLNASLAKVGLYYRTMKHLRPSQIGHRVRLRAKRATYHRWPKSFEQRWRPLAPASVHWPSEFLALDMQLPHQYPDAESNARGIFEFPLGDRRDLGEPIDWQAALAPQLWRYNLHYWEWAFALAAHNDRTWARQQFERLWRSWRAGTIVGRWDEWSPYVVSVRAWAFCNLFGPLVTGSETEADYVRDVEMHAAFLSSNIELDVGGNHLIKNVKALMALGVFLDRDRLVTRALNMLVEQIPVQVLADGGHFERSPSYHCQVLGDLIDMRRLMKAAERGTPAALDEAIVSMRKWLGVMLMPDGDVPQFNDCLQVGVERIAILEPIPPPQDRLTVLPETGYAVLKPDHRIHLVADVGDPCPPQLPAHAHADCLTFVLAIDGKRVIVDSGVTTYEPGPTRQRERSTRAHNTIEVDGADQTEVWGTFRAGHRAQATVGAAIVDGSRVTVAAEHDGYRRLPGHPVHRRTFVADPDGVLIVDEIDGRCRHVLTSRLFFARGTRATFDRAEVDLGIANVSVEPSSAQCIFDPGVAENASLAATISGHLPLRMSMTVRLKNRQTTNGPRTSWGCLC